MSPRTPQSFLLRDRERIRAIADSGNDYVPHADRNAPWDRDEEARGRRAGGGGDSAIELSTLGVGGPGDGDGDDDGAEEEDLDEPERENLTLPESTHTLLFTQPVCSKPFAFAALIAGISIASLSMALDNNLGAVHSGWGYEPLPPDNPLGVPANVDSSVRAAMYLGILIALIMEDEIPTGAHLLRMVPKSSFKEKFPNKSYCRFVASAVLRIFLGYYFLANVLVILLKATDVLGIFYDVLALQFIAELDDIAFSVAKLDVFGRTLRRACTAKLFMSEFEKQKFSRTKAASIFLKTVYFMNLALFLTPMITISMNQNNGTYQCDRIKVDFGDAVWGDALVEESPGVYEERTLPFSTFNGIYVQKDGETENRRPVYRELRKFDRLEFDNEHVPAVIKYSQDVGAWIFEHPQIKKKKNDEPGSWLLRSPDTTEYDLLDVDGNWQIWFGVIDSTQLTYSCTHCDSDVECNLNGECVEGKCICNMDDDDVGYLGPHCEVKLKDKCHTIIDENGTFTWSTYSYNSTPGGPRDTLLQSYNRPVYVHVSGIPDVKEDDINWLVYTGSRWKYIGLNLGNQNISQEFFYGSTVLNFHAFWDKVFAPVPSSFNVISGPTTNGNPVGVDWFVITEWGDQFGPFGALSPVQKDVGRGVFRCAGNLYPELSTPLKAKEVNATDAGEVADRV